MIPIGNAAGDCKRLEQVVELIKTPIKEITLGSILHQERAGNTGNTFAASDDEMFFLNSRGLPCPGREYYKKHLPEIASRMHDEGKRLRVSIAGFNADDYEITAALAAPYADVTEINLGCPNVWEDKGGQKKQKPIASFDLAYAKEIILRVRGVAGAGSQLDVKVSPYSDPMLLAQMAGLVAELDLGVVTSNAFPNALAFGKNNRPLISGSTGLAGFSGPAYKAIALGQVAQFRSSLPAHIQITGVGGIRNFNDVLDFQRTGADRVQVGSYYFQHGPKVFQEILIGEPS